MNKLWAIPIILLLLLGSSAQVLSDQIMLHDRSTTLCLDTVTIAPNGLKENLSDEIRLFVEYFTKEYEGAYITKVRWQLVNDGKGSSTYIIEGIENNNKYILKLLNRNSSAQCIEDLMVLGRVERLLNENELYAGKPLEKPLNTTKYVGAEQISDIALKEYDSTIQEWKVVWVDEKEVIQIILWDDSFDQNILVIDARTGTVLRKT